jgi:hypothetical protein
MEFEKNKPITADDIAMANAPHVTLEPAHGDIRPDVANIPNVARPDNRTFKFETESTAEIAAAAPSGVKHQHHSLALIFAIVTVVIFVAVLALLYVVR